VVGDDGYESGSVLKLTVSGDVYDEMAAPVGSTGRKTTECRQAGDWIESRLDGRRYDFVKLYRAVPGFFESAEWTVFECDGYQSVGSVGRDYVVQNYGEKEGFQLVFRGVVWEIYLGLVVCQRTLHCKAEYPEWSPSKRQSIDVVKLANQVSSSIAAHLAPMMKPTSRPSETKPATAPCFADFERLLKQRDAHSENMMKEFTSTIKAFAPTQTQPVHSGPRQYSLDELKEIKDIFQVQ
jgi:hypothetical protein